MERLLARPMPLPCGFVVRKASKILPAFSGGSPTPVSVTDDGAAFFQHVVDDIDWSVMGTHPLAGHYSSKKAFIESTFARLDLVLPQGAQLCVEHLLVKAIRFRRRCQAAGSVSKAGVGGTTRCCPDFASPTRGLHNRHRDIYGQTREKNGYIERAYRRNLPYPLAGPEIAFGTGSALYGLDQCSG
jgi:hypothetical protein